MKRRIFTIIYLTQLLFYGCTTHYSNIEAYTHAIDLKSISIYSKPGKYYKKLDSDTEGGWIAEVKRKGKDYFEISISDLSLNDVWIRAGELGLTVQNYDSLRIPMSIHPDTTSLACNYLYTSYVGRVYDIYKGFAFLEITVDKKSIKGWVEFKYLCGNPYTTCN